MDGRIGIRVDDAPSQRGCLKSEGGRAEARNYAPGLIMGFEGAQGADPAKNANASSCDGATS